jgi:23S rRNA pseudouridine1911/1915/1917 synthase
MEFTVPQEHTGSRLDQFLVAEIPRLSRSRIQSLIKAGHVLVNKQTAKPNTKLRAGDVIDFSEPPVEASKIEAEEIPLRILFEDDDLAVLDKPPGISVHPGAGTRDGTVVNALLHHFKSLSAIGGIERPGIVHRLDKDTSGCLVVAKNDLAHKRLSEQFAGREVKKIYLALASGHFKNRGLLVDAPIARDPDHRQRMAVVEGGRAAKTTFKVLREIPFASLVECTLHSGRTHQIRVHLKYIGHPLLGDKLYARSAGGYPRQMLHAWRLGFFHPRTEAWMEFESPIPEDFSQGLEKI